MPMSAPPDYNPPPPGSHWAQLAANLRARVGVATRVACEEPLAPRTTLRVGGPARVYAEPAGVEDLRVVVREARAAGVRVFVLGRGSNLLVPDEGVDGLVVALTQEAWAEFEPRGHGRVWVGAGLRLKELCGRAAKAGLAGFEFLEGIPGTVGGALRMNAGAMGAWIFDLVEEVEVLAPTGEMKTIARDALQVEYRQCRDLENVTVLGALLRPGAQTDAEAIARQIEVYREKRQKSQPREASAGCVFRNPPGKSAGQLIDECGLKGERCGAAEVSPVHANFIINHGAARAADVLELIRRVRRRVREQTGIELQPEILFFGRRWEEVL